MLYIDGINGNLEDMNVLSWVRNLKRLPFIMLKLRYSNRHKDEFHM